MRKAVYISSGLRILPGRLGPYDSLKNHLIAKPVSRLEFRTAAYRTEHLAEFRTATRSVPYTEFRTATVQYC